MKKIQLVVLFFLAAVIGVVLTTNPSPSSANPRSTSDSPVAAVYDRRESSAGIPPLMETPRQAGRLSYNPAISEAAQLAPFFSASIYLEDGGSKRPFELATDELYVRQVDGDNRVVKVSKTNSPEAFAAMIAEARSVHGTEPELVLYPIGYQRDEFTRRIATRDVVVNAPSRAEADVLAASRGLVFQKAPVFAPNAFVYKAPTSASALGVLSRQELASADATPLLASLAVRRTMPNDPFVQLQWHLKNQGQKGANAGTDIDVESVWNYPSTNKANSIRGRGVVIGIVDDGMEWSHPDLAPNVIKELQYDWNGQDKDPKPLPSHSHGTACAGVAAARGNNRIGVSGVAPEASLAGMRLIAGPSTDLDEAEAMIWKIGEIHILSNSWGPLDTGSLLEAPGALTSDALKYAADFGRNGRGTIITWAGGNGLENQDNSNYDGYANSIYTIAVAAIGSNGSQALYSESGANLIVSAPSDGGPLGIMTTDNKGQYGNNPGFSQNDFASSGDVTKNFGGTSSACPTVSGVVALMLEKNPNLGWRDVQEILIRTAVKVDGSDADWIQNEVGLHFNHKYGAGLVNAAAAVERAATWINLGPQKSQTVSPSETTAIGGLETITRTFPVDGDILLEHVTLRLTIEEIKKGDLTITLTSPSGTASTFCEPHSDNDPEKGNKFTNWRFMTVRNWGESSSGNWTLTITNNGTTAGNLTAAELVVYGTDPALDAPPVVTLEASATSIFEGETLTLTATAIDKNADGSAGTISALEAFVGGVSLGNSTTGTWTLQANKGGSYAFTVNATDGEEVVTTSEAINVTVVPRPIAAWDFDTTTQNPVPLAASIQGPKRYEANFGSGLMIFDGTFGTSTLWNDKTGEIWKADGSGDNAVGGMWSPMQNNTALLVRGGKDIAANDKEIVFQFSMEGREALNVSYTTLGNDDGFKNHTWSYSTNGADWTEIGEYPLAQIIPFAVGDAEQDALADQPVVYLRIVFSGATAAWGENYIDNIVFSAESVAAPDDDPPFALSNATKSHAAGGFSAHAAGSAKPLVAPPIAGKNQPESPTDSTATTEADELDWVLLPPAIHEMVVHAEVVEGSKFLTAPGSLLSATEEGKVLGLAEPVPQTTRYELGITSADPNPEPLRLKIYDAASKGILVLDEKVPFVAGSMIGSPAVPKRYSVAYQEVEQVVPLAPGWNTFTAAVDPDPATLEGVLIDYDASEGDRLVGPTAEATLVDGKWMPLGFKIAPRSTYSLLRQAPAASQIILKGKALPQGTPNPPHDKYGIWMDLPDGSIVTMDWCDADSDGIDDRLQPGPGQPIPVKGKTTQPPPLGSQRGSHEGTSHAHKSESVSAAHTEESPRKSHASKKSKSAKKPKGQESGLKNSGKKKKKTSAA